MAEENSGNIKLFIGIAILMIIIAAGTSFAFMTYFNKSSDPQKTVSKQKDIGPTYSLGDFLVNLSGTGGYQYIKASIVVEVSKDSVIQELDKRSPQIRDTIITILREQKIEDIKAPGAKVIKNYIKVKLNQILVDGKITAVWFTQLVVQ